MMMKHKKYLKILSLALLAGVFVSAYAYPPIFRPRTIVIEHTPYSLSGGATDYGRTFLQHAGKIDINKEAGTRYHLVLHDVDSNVFWMNNRGDVDSGKMGISRFVNATWFNGPLNFANINPKGLLIASKGRRAKSQFVAVFVLSNPSYNSDKQTVRYDAHLLYNNTSNALNNTTFRNAHLLIE